MILSGFCAPISDCAAFALLDAALLDFDIKDIFFNQINGARNIDSPRMREGIEAQTEINYEQRRQPMIRSGLLSWQRGRSVSRFCFAFDWMDFSSRRVNL